MSTKSKFQADMKELDEKFAAIPDDVKKRYDRHRFIRRAVMTYWASALVAIQLYFYAVGPLFDSFLKGGGIKLSSKVFEYILCFMMIFLPAVVTFYFLKRDKTKRYSYLFVRDQWDSLLAFKIENFASIVLILYPILLFLGSFFVKDDGYGVYAFLYGLVVAPICLLVFALCYSRNKSSYTPPLEAADLRREPALAAQGAKSVEERLGELRSIDAEFEDIPWNLKNRYDIHRFIRRASVAFAGFTVVVAWFASFVSNVLGDLVYLAAVLILPYIFTKIYLKSNQTKKYSRLFIKNQRLSLAIFTVENLASATLILYPLALILVALFSKNAEKIVALLLNSSSVISVCIFVFAACYFFNPGRYIPQDEA